MARLSTRAKLRGKYERSVEELKQLHCLFAPIRPKFEELLKGARIYRGASEEERRLLVQGIQDLRDYFEYWTGAIIREAQALAQENAQEFRAYQAYLLYQEIESAGRYLGRIAKEFRCFGTGRKKKKKIITKD
jgi:hypothetical protein